MSKVEPISLDNSILEQQKFIDEFWKVISQQNAKISDLANQNHELKVQIKHTNDKIDVH